MLAIMGTRRATSSVFPVIILSLFCVLYNMFMFDSELKLALQCGTAVNQVPAGKHDNDVALENPHPTPSISATKDNHQMVFVHVGKSGGSYLVNVMESLQERNGFKYVEGFHLSGGFYPSKKKLTEDLKSLENNTVYGNHVNYIQGFDDWDWISMVRDPFELTNSNYYYEVDPGLRGEKAEEVIAKRKNDTVCGCFGLEFDECINTKYNNNCTIELSPQMAYFCKKKDPECSLDLALSHAENFKFIGITEEMALSLTVFEKLSPWVFGDQAEASTVSKRSTKLFNPITNTTLNGAISTRTRKQLKERAINYHDEIQFYNAMKRRFWKKAVELESY